MKRKDDEGWPAWFRKEHFDSGRVDLDEGYYVRWGTKQAGIYPPQGIGIGFPVGVLKDLAIKLPAVLAAQAKKRAARRADR